MTGWRLGAIAISTLVAFGTLVYLLKVKRIDSTNTVFVSCIIALLYIVSVLALLPSDVNDKVILGLVSIASGLIGFLARGIFEPRNQN